MLYAEWVSLCLPKSRSTDAMRLAGVLVYMLMAQYMLWHGRPKTGMGRMRTACVMYTHWCRSGTVGLSHPRFWVSQPHWAFAVFTASMWRGRGTPPRCLLPLSSLLVRGVVHAGR